MVHYSRLGNNFITLLSFLFLSSALPACLTSQRPLQVPIGDSFILEHSSIKFFSPIGRYFGGCRDVYQHNCSLRRGFVDYQRCNRSLLFR